MQDDPAKLPKSLYNVPSYIELTREELYERIWSEPASKLAPQLGLSDVGLAKTCKRLGIPRPERGYWNRLAAGHPVKKSPLPPAKPGEERSARFTSAADSTTPPRRSKPIPAVLPSDDLALDSRVKSLLELIMKAVPDKDGRATINASKFPHVTCTPALAQRVVAAISVLIRAVEDLGVACTPGETNRNGMAFAKNGDILHMEIEEVLEEEERSQVDKRQPSWEWPAKRKIPSGKLSVRLWSEGDLRGQRTWTETSARRLETIIPAVVQRISEIFEAFSYERAAKQKREREAEERRVREAKERENRDHQERIDQVIAGRVNNLRRAADWWQIFDNIQKFISECERRWRDTQEGKLSMAQEGWVFWARKSAEAFSPFSDGYPDPACDGTFDADAIPLHGPYPNVRKIPDPHPTERSHSESFRREVVEIKPPYPFWLRHQGRR